MRGLEQAFEGWSQDCFTVTLQRRPQAKASECSTSAVRPAQATLRYPLESGTLCVSSNQQQNPFNYFPSLDSHVVCSPGVNGSLADRKVCLQQRQPTPGAQHAPFAQRQPP